MSRENELSSHLLGEEWPAVTDATGPGWYALSDNDHVAGLGPFGRGQLCENAIQREIDRAR